MGLGFSWFFICYLQQSDVSIIFRDFVQLMMIQGKYYKFKIPRLQANGIQIKKLKGNPQRMQEKSPQQQTHNQDLNLYEWPLGNSSIINLMMSPGESIEPSYMTWSKEEKPSTFKHAHHHSILNCTLDRNANRQQQFQPWADHSHEITQYHKRQSQIKDKLKSTRKVSCFETFNPTKGSINATAFSHRSHNSPSARQKACCSRRGKEQEEQKQASFNTISTSNEEKLKWQLEMEIVMKRKRRVSNMLKIRHFGHLKTQNMEGMEKRTTTFGFKTKTRPENWVRLLLTENEPEKISQETMDKKQIKIKTQRSRMEEIQKRKQKSLQIENLYSVLKSYTHRNEVMKRMTHHSEKKKFRPQSEANACIGNFVNVQLIEPRQSYGKLNLRHATAKSSFQFKNTLAYGKEKGETNEFKEKVLEKTALGAQKIHSQSVSLTKQSYAGHSIKNKLRLLKSRNKNEREKKGKPGNPPSKADIRSIEWS